MWKWAWTLKQRIWIYIGTHWGFYLNSLFSSSIKSDPTWSVFMPKFSFRPGRNKQNPDGISGYSTTLSAVVNNILLYTCLDLCTSSGHLRDFLWGGNKASYPHFIEENNAAHQGSIPRIMKPKAKPSPLSFGSSEEFIITHSVDRPISNQLFGERNSPKERERLAVSKSFKWSLASRRDLRWIYEGRLHTR